MSFSNIRFSSDPSSITSLGIMLMLTLMLMVFIHYYFYSKASSSNSAAPKEEKSSSNSSEPKTMVSASTSSIQNSFKYDVFLSFRGEDTRDSFVGHLYEALQRNCIETYKDDKKIEQGKPIKDQLMKSIEESRFYIIVFSKTYASSSWCLDELVKIMECKKTTEQNVYPIFFDVEPTEVRKQSGAVKEAFAEHKKKEAAGKWREAMKEASDLAGWELKGDESELIQIIVDVIFKKKYSTLSNADGNLVGMETRISDVLSYLKIDTEDVRMIGIKGMGGGGKTTLARAVYDQISNNFEGKSFVENVREVSKSSLSGLKKLQKRILKDVLNKQDITFSSVHDGKNMLKDMMRRRKTLVVLDDVDCIDQLWALAGEPNWFKSGSRIIITTRDEQVLSAHWVNYVYDVNLLSSTEAICLFSRYAFQTEIPTRGYEELSGQVVQYAHGLALTIKVLGSSLRGQSEPYWVGAIERLKKIPLKATMERLEISFDVLEEDYKEIFLDVACILKGWKKEDAIRVLESRGFQAEFGLRVLEQKSLITISKYGYLGMHDHLEEMGRNIVRQSHPDEPQRHSRLWVNEEIEDILTNDLGTQETKYLYFDSPGFSAEIAVKGLAKMKGLRFIHIDLLASGEYYESNVVQFDKVSEYLPNSLRFMRWLDFPFSSLPNTFQGKNLVELDIHCSNIVQLWEDEEEKVLPKLRFLTIYGSEMRTFDLRLAPNLERLNIEDCHDFEELHIPVESVKLEYLILSHLNLKSLCLRNTPSLKELTVLEHCVEMYDSNIAQLWEDGEEKVLHKLRFLTIKRLKLRTFDLKVAPNLEQLTIYCKDLVEFHIPADHHSKLEYLRLTASKLTNLHLGNTPNLMNLTLQHCVDLVELQMPAQSLKLAHLDLSHSKLTNLHLGNTPNLEKLILKRCNDLVELQLPAENLKLKELNLSHSKLKTIHLENAPNLETLMLAGCNDLVELQMPAQSLKLAHLDLSHSKLTNLHLGNTPNLEKLILKMCNDLVELQLPAENLKLKELNLSHSKLKTIHLENAPNLETLMLAGCNDLVELQMPAENLKLPLLYLFSHSKLKTIHLGNAPNLERLSLKGCNDLVDFQMPPESLGLKHLDLIHSKLKNLHLGNTPNLETLVLKSCNDLVELQMSAEIPKLKKVDLSHSKLKNLHLGNTPNLEMLILEGCNDLVELKMPDDSLKLQYFKLSHSKLKTLHLGSTLNLETLVLKSCNDLVELQMPAEIPKLEKVHLSHSKLKTLHLGSTPNLEMLVLIGCNDLVELQMPAESPKLEEVNISHSKLKTLYLGSTPNLKWLTLEESGDLVELQMPAESPNLQSLYLYHSKLKTLHLGSTPNLEMLKLAGCNDLVELQMPDDNLKLQYFELSHSKLKTLHLGSTPNLEMLKLGGCNDLVELKMPDESLKLKYLILNHSKLKTLHLGSTPNLETLILAGCNDLVELKIPVDSLKLKYLTLNHSKLKTLHLGNTPNLERLSLKGCNDLVELNAPVGYLKKLVFLDLSCCGRFKSFVFDKWSQTMFAETELHLIAEPTDVCPLLSDNDYPKLQFLCYYKEDPASSFGNLEMLISMGLCACTNLEKFSRSICSLRSLRKLTLEGSIPEVPRDLDQLECLEELIFSSTNIRNLPDSICMLMHLKAMKLKSCWHLEKLPEDLGRLQCLEELDLTECIVLRDIPNSICQMKSLKYFHLPYCFLVEKLPEEIGSLIQLEELNIEGTGISHLPQSIFQLKRLRINGFTWQLQSYGFRTVFPTSTYVSFAYTSYHSSANHPEKTV